MTRKIVGSLYVAVALAFMASAIVSIADPTTGYYPKTASFPPKTCNNDQVVTWESPAWVCKSVGGGGSGAISGLVTAVNGTLPIVATTTDAGVVTVSEAVSPDGGIDIIASGVRLARNIDVDTLKIADVPTISSAGYQFGGHLVIGTGGAVYSGPSSVSVADTVIATLGVDTPAAAINLTTEGTIDWFRVNQAVQFACSAKISSKATGGRALGCDTFTLIEQGTGAIFQTTDANLPFVATASDTTDNVTSGVARFLGVQSGGRGPGATWGWKVTANSAATPQRVIRIYWAQAQCKLVSCTAILPDGTTTTTNTSNADGVISYHQEKITYSTPVPGDIVVTCIVDTSWGTGTPILDVGYITVAPT